MRSAGLIFVAALVLRPAGAQIQIPSAPPAPVAAKTATGTVGGVADLKALTDLEKDIDNRLQNIGGADRCIVLDATRGLYVTGFGAILTTDVDLVNFSGLSPFRTSISDAEKESLHKRKLAQVAILESAVRSALVATAQSPWLKDMARTDQIVIGVRLMYRPWEITTGLPGLIVMRADRQGGNIRMEVQ